MAGTSWTLEEQRELISLRSQRPPATWVECARALGRSKEATRSYYRWLKSKGIVDESSDDFDIEPAEEIGEFDAELAHLLGPELDARDAPAPAEWKDLAKIALETQGAMESIEAAQDIRTVRLSGEPPPIIQYSGDWHQGHRAARYIDWLYHIMMLLRSPNTYQIVLGDTHENVRSFRHTAMVISQVLPPKLQAQLIISVGTEMIQKRKVLAWVLGTHDLRFDESISGEAMLSWFYEQRRDQVAFYQNKGLLKVILDYEDGETKTFTNLLFHKSRYKSFLSTLHSNRREYQLVFPAKVVAGAHNHEPGAEIIWHYGLLESAGYDIGGWSWNVKVGPFTSPKNQLRDYSSFFQPTAIFCPAAVYTKHGIVMLPTLRDALAYRAGLEAATKHEEKVISEIDITDEQRTELLDHLLRRR